MERLQKVLAHAGVASRRKCEELITTGKVEVNDTIITELGTKVDPTADVIKVNGRPIRLERKIYLIFNKPKGVITSVHDPEGRKTVTDYIKDIKERIYPVGRLDYDSEGLLILTNDGQFANLMTHPKHQVPKTYWVTVKGVPHGNLLEKLANGIELEDGKTAPCEVEYLDVREDKNESEIEITIHEGRNRQVRKMFEAISYPVLKLKRVKFGTVFLDGLPRGKYRHLDPNQVKELQEMALQSHKIQKSLK